MEKYLKARLNIFLARFTRATIALFFTIEILIGYFTPLAFAQIKTEDSTLKKSEETKCSITEKYSIVYSYNTVLGEEPELKTKKGIQKEGMMPDSWSAGRPTEQLW